MVWIEVDPPLPTELQHSVRTYQKVRVTVPTSPSLDYYVYLYGVYRINYAIHSGTMNQIAFASVLPGPDWVQHIYFDGSPTTWWRNYV